MIRSRPDTPDVNERATAGDVRAQGVVIRLRLVAPSSGRASGTFTAAGAVSGQGTAVTDPFVPREAANGGAPMRIEGAVRLSAPDGDIVITITTVTRPVPDTHVHTGGGVWTLTSATGAYDGLRATGTLTLVLVYDEAGASTLELVLVGRVPATPGG